MSYLFVFLTVIFTVYGQVVLKWQVMIHPELSIAGGKPVQVILAILQNPWVVSAFAAAFAASLCWIAALSKLPLSKAYPFTAMSFPAIALLSYFMFSESLTFEKLAGTALVMAGIVVLARG